MAASKLSGNLVGVEIDGKFVVCETSCELSFEADMMDASAVDSGRWKGVIAGLRSWSVSVNASTLIQSSASDFNTILNAFISGVVMKVRIRTKVPMIGSVIITGNVIVQSGGLSAAVNSTTGWNTVLQGDGAFVLGTGTQQYQALYGYRLADPFGDELSLVPQFSKFFNNGDNVLGLDFTAASSGNYLFVIIPHGQPIFNAWENNQFNFGPIPDYLWRSVSTIGNYDYYLTRTLQYITSAVPVITLKFNSSAPNPFTFTSVSNVDPLSVNVSNIVTLAGMTTLPYTITNGEISINGGAFTSAPGNLNNGQTIQVRQTAPAQYGASGVTTLNIGSASYGFNVGTKAAVPIPITYTFNKSENPHVNIRLLVFMDDANGVLQPLQFIAFNGSGSISGGLSGRRVVARLIHDLNLPWIPLSKADMSVNANGGSIFLSGDITAPNITDLATFPFVLLEGSTYEINAASSTTATGYKTKNVTLDNVSSVPNDNTSLKYTLYDNTDNSTSLNTGQNGPNEIFGINYLDDANTVLLSVNNSATSNVLISIYEGVTLFGSFVVYAGSSNSINGLPKEDITIRTENV